MLLPFNTANLPESFEEEIKSLMAVVMQNDLMIQQLQLMVALRQKEIEEEENREESQRQRGKEARAEEEKQKELRGEEVRMMREWTEQESQEYVERFRGHREDRKCRKCGWFGHVAHYCWRMEIEAEREQRRGLSENRWKPLECRVMACEEKRMAVHSVRREVQQLVKCWGYEEEGHHLWTCPKKAACPIQGKVQQRKLRCEKCKEENHVARNCDNYWR